MEQSILIIFMADKKMHFPVLTLVICESQLWEAHLFLISHL